MCAAVPTSKVPGFEYVFPAIRGVQAGRDYFVTMCPLRIIPRLFLFDDEELPAEMRAQRQLNRVRVPEIARYIVDNPDSYIFSALTASVNAEVVFEPLAGDSSQAERIGTLTIPMSATFVINDGQHRRAAIQQALAEDPSLGDETIAIVMFVDVGLERCQQMFADLNRYATRVGPSLGVLYDHRDPIAEVTRRVVFDSAFLRDVTDTERSNLATRSRKLFTLSALHTATSALLDQIEVGDTDDQVRLAGRFWEKVSGQFPQWHQVFNGGITAGEVRRDFIHTHSIVLHALGHIGNELLRTDVALEKNDELIAGLREIDWHRDAPHWEGRAVTGGSVTKSRKNVDLTTQYIRQVIGLESKAATTQAKSGRKGATQ